MRPTFTGAAHVTHGDCAAQGVREAGAVTLHVVRDLLTYGPCDVDPARHVPLRLRHWGLADAEAPGFVLAPTLLGWAATQPIVLWATRAWSDQLFLWWTLDALARAQIDTERLWWAAPHTAHPLASTGAAVPAALADALAQAQPIAPALVDAARTLWHKFAAPSPLAFDEARRGGVAALPELAVIAESHGGWFPRRLDGRLRLSELDEQLLSNVADPVRQGPPQLLYPYGDRLLLQRRDEWLARGAVMRDAGGYTLTDAGRRLVTEGIADVAAAPPIFVGGCGVNDPALPWVRISDGETWRLST